jgi:hypothetical protein
MSKLSALVLALLLSLSGTAAAQFTASSPLNFGPNFNKNPTNGQIGIQYFDNWVQDPFPVRSYQPVTGITAVNNGDVTGWRTSCTTNSTGTPGALDTGWTNITCGRIYMNFFHGTNTGAAKTTDMALQLNNITFGAGQSFGMNVSLNSLAAHDHQNIVVSNTYYGGIASAGDEGPVGYGMSMTNPDWYDTAHVYGNIIRGAGSAHTTAALTARNSIQSIPVDNVTGFAVGEWVEINNTDPAYGTGYRQAMKITAVGPGNTISGLVEIDQVSGVPITPATLIPINIQTEWADYGEHRWVVNLNAASYSAGTMTWAYAPDATTGSGSNRVTGTSTAFSNSMVGGDVNVPGCVSQDSDTNHYGSPAWFPIKSVDSPTQLTTIVQRQTDPVPLTGAAYHIKPCAEILRILGFDVPGTVTGYLIVETNSFPWPNGSLIETAIGPSVGANGATYNMFDYVTESRSVSLQLNEEGQMAPLGAMLSIRNFGQNVRTVGGAQQSAFIEGIAASSITPGFTSGSIGNGIFMSGMRDGVTFAYGSHGSTALDHYGVLNNSTQENSSADFLAYRYCCSMETDPIWNFTDRQHVAWGGFVTDNSGRTDNKLISIKYDNGTTGGPQEKFAVDTNGTILKGQFSANNPGITIPLMSAIPFVLAGDGSFGANGAFTLTNPLNAVYSTAYMYFPANAIGAGIPAGWYYCEMDHPNSGHCYNNLYGGGIPILYYGLPTRLPFTTTGAAYTQTVNTPIPAMYYTAKANTVSNRAAYRTTLWVATSADTNTKQWQVTYGGVPVGMGALTTAAQFGQRGTVMLTPQSDLQFSQISNYASNDSGFNNGFTASPIIASVNSQADQPLAVTLSISNGASYMVLDFMSVEFMNAGGTRTN